MRMHTGPDQKAASDLGLLLGPLADDGPTPDEGPDGLPPEGDAVAEEPAAPAAADIEDIHLEEVGEPAGVRHQQDLGPAPDRRPGLVTLAAGGPPPPAAAATGLPLEAGDFRVLPAAAWSRLHGRFRTPVCAAALEATAAGAVAGRVAEAEACQRAEAVESPASPRSPAAEPRAEPAAELAEPVAEPAAAPAAAPVEPPAEPAAEPAEPPAVPAVELAEPAAQSAAELAEPPTVPAAELAEPPAQSAAELAEPPAEPAAEPAEPPALPAAERPAEPTAEPPALPAAEPPAEPTAEPPALPAADPPAEPVAQAAVEAVEPAPEAAVAAAMAQAEEREPPPVDVSGMPSLAVEEEDPGDGACRVCPICFDPLFPAEGQTFCGVHLYCQDCAAQSARADLRKGRVPRCPDCSVQIEPVAARQILDYEDLQCYQNLALWSNDGVTVCPKCKEGLFADAGEDAGARCGTASCPACRHEFCVECRGPAHPDIADCDEAAKARLGGQRARRRARANAVPGLDVKLLPAPFPCSVSATAAPPTPTGSMAGGVGSSLASNAPETLSLFGAALNLKRCPRCRAPVEKQDEDSCDHMTCVQCRHEFCWSCLADRVAIYAHGNHFHRPRCRFYAPYSGPLEYIPDRCRRCAHRGAPCTPPNSVAIDSDAIAPVLPMGSLDTWLRSLVEIFTLRGCQMLAH